MDMEENGMDRMCRKEVEKHLFTVKSLEAEQPYVIMELKLQGS